MKEIPTKRENILRFFSYLPFMFDGERFKDIETSCQFIFTDIDDGLPVYIMFHEGSVEYSEGFIDAPRVTVRVASSLWLDITSGEKSAAWALFTRKLRVEGRLSDFRLLPKLLTKKHDVPHSLPLPKRWTPPLDVLVINGSPRKKEGLTSFYLKPFMELSEGRTRHPRRVQRPQSEVLFAICGFPEYQQFGPLISLFERHAISANMPLAAKVLISGAMGLFYSPNSRRRLEDTLDAIQTAGEQVVKKGRVDIRVLKRIRGGKIPKGWQDGANIYWLKEMQEKKGV